MSAPKIIRSIASQQRLGRNLAAAGKRIGIVPTMGYLHEGHVALIKRARKEADVVVVTVFVNPTQFAPGEDYERYPRDSHRDLKLIREVGGDFVFMPHMADMYPPDYKTYVTVEELTSVLEGKARPSHFRGVTTVVAKLFNIVRPDVAVFGMKDYQQAMVLKKMVGDLNYAIKFIIAPTVREKDGLAKSSRNTYLTAGQRAQAVALYRALKTAREMVRGQKITDSAVVQRKMRQVIGHIAPEARIDYIALTDFESLQEVKSIRKNTVASLAVYMGNVRLLDNMKIA